MGKELNVWMAEGWTDKRLNEVLEGICMAAGTHIHTWHDLRKTSTQFMKDLSYPNIIMQVLGTWKLVHSMKTYIRERNPLLFNKKTRKEHECFISILSERLQRLCGSIVWLCKSSKL